MPTAPPTAARYAAVTSTLALVVALGGTSYAAVRIGTKDLKNGAVTSVKMRKGAVTGAKIRNGAVTGADVDERSLGVVPNADTALRAGDATTVGDVSVTPVDGSLGTGPGRPFFPFGSSGLDVELTCTEVGGTILVGLDATTTRPSSTIATVVITDSNPGQPLEADREDSSFSPGDTLDLLAGDDGDLAQVTFTYRDDAGSRVQGVLVTDRDDSVIPNVCTVTGYVLSY